MAAPDHLHTLAFDSVFLQPDAPGAPECPCYIGDRWLVNGEVRQWTGLSDPVMSPVYHKGATGPTKIGSYAMLGEEESLEAVASAVKAFDGGRGKWPLMSPADRIAAVEKFAVGLKSRREEIVVLLMWEIAKNRSAAEKEVDRTLKYIEDTIRALKDLENRTNTYQITEGFISRERRAPYGVVLTVAPFNYPLNESYTLVIPALIMGNSVVLKLPRTGVLCHGPTLDLFASCFPPGVVNVISGSGRSTMPPLMKSGLIDLFAFIGTSKAADAVHKEHPTPHRLRVCLGLEAKNAAIVFPDADMKNAISECILGSLSYNGQRCTAIKVIFVHESIAEKFVADFSTEVDKLAIGMPWEKDAFITPLPETEKPAYLWDLLQDATKHGAKVANKRGGIFDRSLVSPTVVYPVNKDMRIYHEEQFGPLVPITTFREIEDVLKYMRDSQYGQQCSIFTQDANKVATMVDTVVNTVCRVNINSQCQRGPDTFPFTGRKQSAMGTLSVHDALRTFSIRSVVVAKETESGRKLLSTAASSGNSHFLAFEYLF